MISKHTVMAFLTVSAVVLATLLAGQLLSGPDALMASSESQRAGNLVACTSERSGSQDILWVLNVQSRQLIACEQESTGEIVVLSRASIARAFGDQ